MGGRRPKPWSECVAEVGTCWIWLLSLSTGKRSSGYGRLNRVGRTTYAHRYVYEELVGPISEGLTLDHLCGNRACVNPAHLEPVTLRENVLRSSGITATQARLTHCKRGHEFTPENTAPTPKGGRACLACRKSANRQRYLHRKALKGPSHAQ